jgi:hypothetical protein
MRYSNIVPLLCSIGLLFPIAACDSTEDDGMVVVETVVDQVVYQPGDTVVVTISNVGRPELVFVGACDDGSVAAFLMTFDGDEASGYSLASTEVASCDTITKTIPLEPGAQLVQRFPITLPASENRSPTTQYVLWFNVYDVESPPIPSRIFTNSQSNVFRIDAP